MGVTFIVFLLILGLLVFVHEFGHFWVAKKSGVKVHEFAFGFKPRLFSWKRGGTEYAINLLPFGGYVRLEGESEDTGKEGSFTGKPPLVRARVLVAGVIMNLVLAWVLLTFSYIVGSYPLTPTFDQHTGVVRDAKVMVLYVAPQSPAEKVGLKPRDTVVAVGDQPVTSAGEFTKSIKSAAGSEVRLTYSRDGRETTVTVTPRANPPAGQGALGIGTDELTVAKAPWTKAPAVALFEVGSEIKSSFTGFFQFVGQLIAKHEVNKDVSGIVGIGAATGIVRRLGIGPLTQFIALISTNLAVINILPILPLDGGHLFFVAVEAWRKKPVEEIVRQRVAAFGLAAILFLFVVVTYQDFIRFAIIDRIKGIF